MQIICDGQRWKVQLKQTDKDSLLDITKNGIITKLSYLFARKFYNCTTNPLNSLFGRAQAFIY